MKYVVLICDGMADYKLDILNGMTPMEAARKPYMDMLASQSRCGTVRNVPDGMVPESDTANLAVLSYDPKIYSKGRAPLEAVSIGLTMKPRDTAFRCNVVTISEEEGKYEDRTMIDHGADEITTEEANVLIQEVEKHFGTSQRRFFTGVSYRHCMLWENAPSFLDFSRPHDIIGCQVGKYLPYGEEGKAFLEMMEKSFDFLNHHPINEKRRERGLHPANSVWFWSPGGNPALPSFEEKWKVKAAMISAVDLLKGIGKLAGMTSIDVEGATGNINTNFEGKAQAAIAAMENGHDFVYIHVEAPDECGHRGEAINKKRSIEYIDERVLKPIYEYLKNAGEDFKILVLPDHPTPISLRTHSSEAVPFFLYDSREKKMGCTIFSEENCQKMHDFIPKGENLLDIVITK